MPRHSRRRSPSPESDAEPRKVLPARSSRGARIHKLIGEEAEADASFWGQAAWQEEGEDDDYSTEAEEEDVVDSDFDADEAPDEEIHDAEEDEKPTKRKRSATSSGRYKEPLQPRQAKRYVAPTVRSSTARKSSESSEMRRRASHEAAKLAAKSKKPIVEKTGNRLTQAQLIAEAVRTEVENTQSLQRLEQLEEEKKAESVAPKAPFTGSMVRYYSKLGAPKTITFINTLNFPSIFNQSKPKKRISSQEQKINRLKREQEEEEEEEENESVQDEDVEEKDSQQHGVLQNTTPTAAQAAA
ncbi:uncharacterized protein PITG_09588 [Phytophthora infestans T30-4]|uniref:Vps72/YL1 N-terminal domain-containing protein n=1 Tax=Phytophthora infestans (strain T30-4) TaxID=403677 RepID=D0NCC4_PHYIT|nr:uncharacterized protein PITG_09588 [Phytophthora infestans T30-4]EEY55638.1 conserved hypothetical protein [Phytophthora infestans T30-4]|eukprot:XP_002903214.1 conserved hypothetical protein [Phytophthora infestans T30-4]